MKYAEIRNHEGSQMIDDTYENFRLSWTQSASMPIPGVTGVHIDVNEKGERICTYPYLDHANRYSFLWKGGNTLPPRWFCAESECLPRAFTPFRPGYYIGSPFQDLQVSEGYGNLVVRPTIALLQGPEVMWRSKVSGIQVPHIMALASAMPNIVYTFTQYAKQGFHVRWPIQYRINLWQRAASVELPIYERGTFSGNNVGYTELELVAPYIAPQTSIKCYFKTKDNEKFRYWTFEQEAKLSTMIFAYGLEDSKIEDDRGEMVIKNERGETIFNNRYDYMRILKYFSSINALRLEGDNLRNAPKRFSFPGRRIAVVALHPYCCIANKRKGREGFIFNTGFWFPDPSTVEFTSCASMVGNNFEGYYSAHPNFVKMAELINVMILDVTGCTPGWRYELKYRNGDPGVYI